MPTEAEWVSRLFTVPPPTARRYLDMCGGTADSVSLVAQQAVSSAPSGELDWLPKRYPLDVVVAAGSVEAGMRWLAVHLHPAELHKGDSADGLFGAKREGRWSDVLDVVRSVPSHIEASDIARLVRSSQWSGAFPVEHAVKALESDLGWEYILALSLD